MSKAIKTQVKLQIGAGKATPAPPVGSTLGPHGINIPLFVKSFNDQTAKDAGLIIPVVVTIYTDRSFDFVLKTPPTAVLIKKVLGLESGSKKPNTDKVGKITRAQITEIAKQKLVDMNTTDLAAAESMVAGAARSMGVVVVD
ncbi:MAG: 50S ribosomal protein L11 [Firmicutes bacterium]|nr:50S ribosomal protein L11 [Bacillota bacterium]